MTDKIEDNGSFSKNLEKFINKGYLASKQKEIFEIALEAGHAGMHRNYEPSIEDLNNILNITESIIQNIYIHKKHMEKIKTKISKRQPLQYCQQ